MRHFLLLGAFAVLIAGCADPMTSTVPVANADADSGSDAETASDQPLVVEVDKAQLKETLEQNSVTFVDFTATWCGPCQQLKPELHKMAEEFAGKVRFVEVDVDKGEDLAQEYEIAAMPTLLIIKDGEIQERIVGAGDVESIRTAIKAAL